MQEKGVQVIADPDKAAALLSPVRLKILELLREPGSAASISRNLDVPRQRVAYHVKELEKVGFLEHVGDRRKGNCLERVVQTAASHFLVAPETLGPLGLTPAEVRDRFSSSYLVAVASQAAREVADAQRNAEMENKKLATMTLQADVRFSTPAARAGFAEELTRAFADLVKKYHDDSADEGRYYRFMIGGYPAMADTGATAEEQTH